MINKCLKGLTLKRAGTIIARITATIMMYQLVLMQQQMKQDYGFRRLEFLSELTNHPNKDYDFIKYKIIRKEQIVDERDKAKLLSWINEFEYLFDLFYEKNLVTESELNIFFKGYIVNTCNYDQVITTINKAGKGYNGLKQFCYCMYDQDIDKDYLEAYKTSCVVGENKK